MEMVKDLIFIFKISHRTTGVDWRNGLFFALFGPLEDLWMKMAEKYLTQSLEISNQYSQEITRYTIII